MKNEKMSRKEFWTRMLGIPILVLWFISIKFGDAFYSSIIGIIIGIYITHFAHIDKIKKGAKSNDR